MISNDERELVRSACDRYRLRNRIGDRWGLKKKNAYGNGVSLLLYGPPGTGKTMVAQVIAHELSLPLYRVDVSQIFSKFIGETEKNLGTIFDSASKGNVILFFDEADALFSRRTEVSHSNDKYSNSETAYLLQKIEEYDGMSILATNCYSNFDEAFVRRITYIVHMGWPDAEQRYELWTKILPKETEIEDDIDFAFFAQQFELSGSSIKAILYNAAYMAGAEDVAVSIRHIIRAMKYELKKAGNQLDSAQLGPYGRYL
ncbi:MAG: ATP-binding protein [Lachnospiraceae bacterium]|nr:ATP-binding protein [Lachnospiraceae bacterium]